MKKSVISSNFSRRPLRIFLDDKKKDKEEGEKILKKQTEKFVKEKELYKELISVPDEKDAYEKLNSAWNEFLIILNQSVDLSNKGLNSEAFKVFNAKGRPFQLVIESALNQITEVNNKGAIESTQKGKILTSYTSITVCSILILSLLILIIIIQIVRKTTLSIEKSIDELKEQSNKMKTIGGILKESAHNLSHSVTEQAASVHETSAAINEITSMVNRTTENSKESSNIAKSSSQKAKEGEKIMNDLVLSMESIQESNTQLQNISDIIKQIHAKTAMINEIVTKTELLSLNASIESARAGEYGKGFAVVAEEVGNLAKVSGKSALEIQELITTSQEQVNKILGITKERIDSGKKITGLAQETFHFISDNIQSLSSVLEQISDATKEQEVGVKQISTAMSQIDNVTQKSQETSLLTSESSQNVSEQSEKLAKTSNKIEFLIRGKNS
ncbi:HAMP domain-containing methyl-accepting chemotaxis protein [Fluviispira sanaruensis]|uniref:HAMP domain-containing methyl-accepting chemotaxis protein n=1 Tax=Fluviispira sanaruensis TaxID=2493639 RepID=UPI0015595A79|nr:methyl-accepting chemotaxis protein [Fluviispira sanaruensis]